ncbi:stress response protein NhaX-like [Saccostrea echinata]|uniref:stress response protein NhaX-like n=1 Tax=Saccostrea echinata TaxID=191078 RepID=UPI002A812E36|nr:stress response protein NhaX-like [Saccostrea echinata]
MKVLIAVDGSKCSRDALEWYMRHFHLRENKVTLVHVTDHLHNFAYNTSVIPADPELIQLAYQEEEHKAKTLMDEMGDFLSKNQIDGEVIRLFGNPGELIVKKAHEMKATLLITGSRGLGLIRRTVLGSVSDFVIHHSEVPVMVYKH